MLSVMKGCSNIGAMFVLAIGVGMLAITLYGFFHQQLFFNDLSVRNIVLGIMVAADVIIIFGAIMGIYGIKKGRAGCICVFQLLVILFFFVFSALTIIVLIMPGLVFEGNCSQSKNTLIMTANQAYNSADDHLCRTCNCALNEYTVKERGLYSPNEQQEMLISLGNSIYGGISGIKAVSFESCPEIKSLSTDILAIIPALKQIEISLQCSGWCDDRVNWIYKFSDINAGRPEGYCYYSMKNAFDKYGSFIGYSLLGVSIFLLMICSCNICLCCHPQRKNQPFASRFIYHEAHYTHIRQN